MCRRWHSCPGFLNRLSLVLNCPLDRGVYDITSSALVTDSAGTPIKGHDVTLTVNRDTFVSYATQTVTYRTDDSGRINITTQMPACSGAVLSQPNYGPPGSPTDHWSGTAQRGVVIFTLPDASPAVSRNQSFLRICKETYLGYY